MGFKNYTLRNERKEKSKKKKAGQDQLFKISIQKIHQDAISHQTVLERRHCTAMFMKIEMKHTALAAQKIASAEISFGLTLYSLY